MEESEKMLKTPPGITNHKHWDSWLAFHLANRKVIRLIIDELKRAQENGLSKASIKTIIGCIRWNMTVETKSNDEYKINDKYTSIYGWMIAHNFPEFTNMIQTRTLRSYKNGRRNKATAKVD